MFEASQQAQEFLYLLKVSRVGIFFIDLGPKLVSISYVLYLVHIAKHSCVKRCKTINAEKSESFVSAEGNLVLADLALV